MAPGSIHSFMSFMFFFGWTRFSGFGYFGVEKIAERDG